MQKIFSDKIKKELRKFKTLHHYKLQNNDFLTQYFCLISKHFSFKDIYLRSKMT